MRLSGSPWRIRNCTEWKAYLRWIQVQIALNACRYSRQNDTGAAFESFGATIDDRNGGRLIN